MLRRRVVDGRARMVDKEEGGSVEEKAAGRVKRGAVNVDGPGIAPAAGRVMWDSPVDEDGDETSSKRVGGSAE